MKLILLAAAVALGFFSIGASAQTLNLDPNCGGNGYDEGIISWIDGPRRRCALPAAINACNATVILHTAVSGTNILWTMPTVVTVGDGHLAGKTPSTVCPVVLQINAGARLAGAIANSALVITRGSRLNALGAATNPIVFSSIDPNYTGTAEWGGVILSSWDDTNECNTGGECTMEGISDGQYFYGGYVNETTTASWDNISSGVLRYVTIAEGGHSVNVDIDGDPDPNSNTGDEINGLTLYGVSAETAIANVHIHNSDDDGIQFFGGDIDVANVWVSCAGDDSVAWDYGFHGHIFNLNILQNDGADHAFELSNNPNNYTATPVAQAQVSNVTLQFADSSPAIDTPFDLKAGTAGSFTNVKIGSAYTGNCFSVDFTDGVDFSAIERACIDPWNRLGPPPPPPPVTGFPNNTFWTDYPANCN